MKIRIFLFIILLILCSKEVIASSELKILVTIKPFHSLVSAVMDGVVEPDLLLKENDSPHSYSLKPSSAKIIQDADVIFWGGKSIEIFLEKSLKVLKKKAKLVSLIETEGLTLLRLRNFKKFHKHGFLDSNEYSNISNSIKNIDPHIWLDPLNSKIILDKVVNILSEIDPNNETKYIKNGEKYKKIINELDKEISLKMIEVSNSPFFVLHDAFQYFEKRYGLNNIGHMELGNSFGMSVRRMKRIRKIIKTEKIPCVFSESNTSQKLLNTAVEGTSTKIEILDPLGVNIKKGSQLYFDLLNNISIKFLKCLKGNY